MAIWQSWKGVCPILYGPRGRQIPIYLELKNEPFDDRLLDGGVLESGGGKFCAIRTITTA